MHIVQMRSCGLLLHKSSGVEIGGSGGSMNESNFYIVDLENFATASRR